jgi:hypothetical protein
VGAAADSGIALSVVVIGDQPPYHSLTSAEEVLSNRLDLQQLSVPGYGDGLRCDYFLSDQKSGKLEQFECP